MQKVKTGLGTRLTVGRLAAHVTDCRQQLELINIIGVSLSEPHASVTALHMCVCMFACLLGPTTYRKFQMSAFKYFTKIDIVHEACEGQWRPDCQSAALATRSEDD